MNLETLVIRVYAYCQIKRILAQPGKPTQNAYIESFNGKFCDECLNEHWFETLAQARTEIARWRQDYNESRPHSSLNDLTPGEYARRIKAMEPA